MTIEHFDVVVVGAGISGIGAGYHLQAMSPDRSYVILEGRAGIGGTWDLFRYPGVRSDSDMHTLGYSFKPWTSEKAIADGPSILAYLRETVSEFGIDRHIRFGHLATNAEWSSDDARWTVTATDISTDTSTTGGERREFTCNYLFMCSGYYSYKAGHTPEFAGIEQFQGTVVHPQQWPEDLDYAGRRVVVVGSGATAMTLIPAIAKTAAHVTMLQRSPTYVAAGPDKDVIANTLRKVLPAKAAYAVTRKKNIALQQFIYGQSRTKPARMKANLIKRVRKALGPDYDVATHFTPTYNPWDQRLCLVPNGDLFDAINSGRASVVTDHIDTFTPTGIRLQSGEELAADIVVTATGLELVTLGEMRFVVDGEPVDFAQTWTYKGFAYSGVPNLASSFGYINASWTLRADLTCEYVCRLLNHMATTGTVQCTPRLRPEDAGMPERPWIDGFTAGYMQREMHRFPRQGDREPWINPQSYTRDKKMFRTSALEDGAMQFTSARMPVAHTG
ncbi:MAG: NAD(P)/FAD-dependent oxidoreductase [Ilumatobacteraceae bacterium]|nr:NAD(P)/FAD-dependent oxidoreductase [Acidimicrobiaceae bacterium]MBP6487128.1 NAD(P)/FAD-dependent oxidoreductase [Ilumatobacteraceae bacterium]MBP7890717.1 NAD(P)/FAD-dependent oxidoreductase [Ilumatobacteraceae bacterium]MBP8208463.1 NAD(P)/FAD-dependent oxidoreductase [Ilumatobacteraceae bacterium]